LDQNQIEQKVASIRRSIQFLTVTGLTCLAIGVVSFISGILSSRQTSIDGAMAAFAFLMIAAIILFVLSYMRTTQYKRIIKNEVLKSCLEKHFDNVNYKAEAGFSREEIASTELVSMGNRFHSNDYLSAYCDGVYFERSDVLVQDHRSSGKSSYTVTLFRGRWMKWEFNKNFHGVLQIRGNSSLGFRSRKPFKWASSLPNMEKLTFENPEFNKQFTCYASDSEDAYYLITPHFMEKLMKLTDDFDCPVYYEFLQGYLHIAIYNDKDAFEPKVMGFDLQGYQKEIDEDCALLHQVVEILKLDDDHFKAREEN